MLAVFVSNTLILALQGIWILQKGRIILSVA